MAEHDATGGDAVLELDQDHTGADGAAGDQTHDNLDGSGDSQDGAGAEPDDDLEISFGDESTPAPRGDNSDLAKHLRAEIRKRDEELATLRRAQPAPQPIDPGPKPTLEGCDYDGDKFEAALDTWKDRKQQAEQGATQAQQAQRAEADRFQQRLQVYGSGKEALKVKDFDVAESAVTSTLSTMQQAVALKAAAEPAKLIYALGRHTAKLAELAKVADPIEFAVAIVKLEGQLKMTQRRAPEPDVPVRGAGQFTPKTDPVLDKLERDAARTGDRTLVVRHKRDLAEKAAAKAKK